MTSTMLGWPQRTETIRWNLLDRDNNPLGQLMVNRDEEPGISNDTTRSIRRNVSSITIPSRPLIDRSATSYYAEDVDPLSMRVQPSWTMADGSQYSLGIFLWGDDSQRLLTYGTLPRVSSLVDLCALIDQPIDDSIGYGAGAGVYDALVEIVEGEGLSAGGLDYTDAMFGVAVGWAAGRDTYLTVLDGLCKIAGFLPPYFDNTGLLRCRAAPDIASASPDFVYGFGSGGVVPGSAVFSNDLLTAPNRYVAIGGNTDAELVGIFDVPDAAPNSFVNTGRYRRKTENVQGISTQADANGAAAALYASDISTYSWLSFDARTDPRHDTWNIVSFDGVNYREVGWTIKGETMSHSVRGTYA